MKINEKFEGDNPIVFPRQILRIMKLTMVIMTACLLQVSALTKAQITLKTPRESMQKVLENISKQSGYDFVYSTEDLKQLHVSNINLTDVTIEIALKACFAGQPLMYDIADKTVMIKRKEEPTFLDRLAERWAAVDVRGRVVDSEGKPLRGASVKVKGVNKVTSTNGSGEFFLQGIDESAVLVISFIGYQTREVAAAATTMGDIRLEIATSDLEEVTINKGYYTTSKELNTGNVSSLKAEDIVKQPVGDPLAALQGRIPGLFIQQSSGAPGRSFTVKLRGQNSIANGNDPLYIIDGIPFNSTPLNSNQFIPGANAFASPVNDINPSDIESIEVLKDADATAIYGSRGANGVILINTKKGKAGKTNFDVNIYNGIGKVTRKLDLMNTEEYLTMRRQAFKNDDIMPGQGDNDLNGTFDQSKFTDWQKILIGGTAKLTDAQASLSGGNINTQFRIGAGFRHEGTVFPGDLNSTKGSSLFSLTHQSDNEKLKISMSVSYVNGGNHLPPTDITKQIILAPNSPDVYNSEGKLNWSNSNWINPFSQILKTSTEKTNNLNSRLLLGYKILKGLTINSSFGYNNEELDQSIITPYTALNPNNVTDVARSREHDIAHSDVKSWIIEPQISYSKTVWKGFLDVIVGSTFQETRQESLSQIALGFSSDDIIDNMAAASVLST